MVDASPSSEPDSPTIPAAPPDTRITEALDGLHEAIESLGFFQETLSAWNLYGNAEDEAGRPCPFGGEHGRLATACEYSRLAAVYAHRAVACTHTLLAENLAKPSDIVVVPMSMILPPDIGGNGKGEHDG